jgi:hypothetical protein
MSKEEFELNKFKIIREQDGLEKPSKDIIDEGELLEEGVEIVGERELWGEHMDAVTVLINEILGEEEIKREQKFEAGKLLSVKVTKQNATFILDYEYKIETREFNFSTKKWNTTIMNKEE